MAFWKRLDLALLPRIELRLSRIALQALQKQEQEYRWKMNVVYTLKLSLYDYQEEVRDWARELPCCVACLPTGSGKTFIGCAWCVDLLNRGEVSRVLVLEPTRCLVEQTEQAYKDGTDIPVGKVYGINSQAKRRGMWKDNTVVITTAQTAVADVDQLDFDAVIVDECHHATGFHAYVQLLQVYPGFVRKLGLSATIPKTIAAGIRSKIGEIRSWSWDDERIMRHLPDCVGDLFEAELDAATKELIKTLENLRKTAPRDHRRGLISSGIRMLCRDGAVALQESASKENALGEVLAPVRNALARCMGMHKTDALQQVFEAYPDFEKAIVFVDRLIIAKELHARFSSLHPVLIASVRLQDGNERDRALEQAKQEDTHLIIATPAGEEGIDIPRVDLVVAWSNTGSAIRAVQRAGRAMRGQGSKLIAFIVTPETPDYDAFVKSLRHLKASGLDLGLLEGKVDIAKEESFQLNAFLQGGPQLHAAILAMFAGKESRVEGWFSEKHDQGEIFYFYHFSENLRGNIEKILRAVSADSRFAGKRSFSFPLSFNSADRYEALVEEAAAAEADMEDLFDIDDRISFTVLVNPVKSRQGSGKHARFTGTAQELFNLLEPTVIGSNVRLTANYTNNKLASLTARYEFRFFEDTLRLSLQNFACLCSQFDTICQRINKIDD